MHIWYLVTDIFWHVAIGKACYVALPEHAFQVSSRQLIVIIPLPWSGGSAWSQITSLALEFFNFTVYLFLIFMFFFDLAVFRPIKILKLCRVESSGFFEAEDTE